MRKVTPVILSGGSGTRLWPLSRQLYPKQFLPLVGGESMLVETLRRLPTGPEFAAPVVICNEQHRFIVAEQLRGAAIRPHAILLEPVGRSTAPAAALAALLLARESPESLVLLSASDHAIRDADAWRQAIGRAALAAAAGQLVTFGIAPHTPETGFGYIKTGAATAHPGVCAVECFVEKPEGATAERYLASGGYVWNSGSFLFRADRFLEELDRLQPRMLAACRESLDKASSDLDFLRLDREAFEACPAESIDYAVMEKTNAAAVVPVDMGWSDVGSWNALWEIGGRDEAGTVKLGDVTTLDAEDCYLRSEDGRLLVAVGVRDLVVVTTGDAVFVARRDRAADVRQVVDRLKRNGRAEAIQHETVYRPWGWYQSVDAGDRFQVKRIMVKPGGRLSAQLHHHRAEHWVIVQGTARVVRGEESVLLSENQSIYIPLGTPHRLENPGKLPLHIIEVQSGAYLGEDDIVRFNDDYGRL